MLAGIPNMGTSSNGSKDGPGAADNDKPYEFGHRPTCKAPWPFTERQYARLLCQRSRRDDGSVALEHFEQAPPIAETEDG